MAEDAAASVSSSGRARRVDEEHYAGALQAVSDMIALGGGGDARAVSGVTDRVEGMLLEELEAADADDSDSSDSGVNVLPERESLREESFSAMGVQYEQIEDDEELSAPAGSLFIDRRKLFLAYCLNKLSRWRQEAVQFTAVSPFLLVVVSCLTRILCHGTAQFGRAACTQSEPVSAEFRVRAGSSKTSIGCAV